MIESKPKKRTSLAVVLFSFLVGFEVIYMISPFGLYCYHYSELFRHSRMLLSGIQFHQKLLDSGSSPE